MEKDVYVVVIEVGGFVFSRNVRFFYLWSRKLRGNFGEFVGIYCIFYCNNL